MKDDTIIAVGFGIVLGLVFALVTYWAIGQQAMLP